MKQLFWLTSQFWSDEAINFLISVHVPVPVRVHTHVQDMETDMETDTDRDRDTDGTWTWTWTWKWTTIANEATLSIDVEKVETMKRLFAFKIGHWSDIIASKCLILKQSSDNFASKIQNVRWSDNVGSSDHDRKIVLSELRPPLLLIRTHFSL